MFIFKELEHILIMKIKNIYKLKGELEAKNPKTSKDRNPMLFSKDLNFSAFRHIKSVPYHLRLSPIFNAKIRT